MNQDEDIIEEELDDEIEDDPSAGSGQADSEFDDEVVEGDEEELSEGRNWGPVVFYTILVLFLVVASLLAGFAVFLK